MMEMFIFEMTQLVDQLEQHVVQSESEYSTEAVNEIFRIMHTIKGSAAMMMFDGIAEAAHTMEDLFYYIREKDPGNVDFSALTDHVLEAMDFIKGELAKISDGDEADGNCSDIAQSIRAFLITLTGEAEPAPAAPTTAAAAPASEAPAATADSFAANRFSAHIKFEEGCEMENIRSYTLVHNLGGRIFDYTHTPEDIIDEESIPLIRENGFTLEFSTNMSYDEVYEELEKTVYLRELSLKDVKDRKSVV
jgi:two-component system chemotaxis sensor kinase CheA